jgi:multidrug resistance efflux pump
MLWFGLVPVLLLGAALGGSFLASHARTEPAASSGSGSAGPESATDENQHSGEIPVQVIQPRADPSFQMTVQQPAYVDAYYQAALQARVAGPIKFLEADIGDKVRAGEVLVRIDVPDLEEEVLQKDALVRQRQRELELAQANIKSAEAAVEASRGIVKQKESEVLRADATRSFREKELRRFKVLAAGRSPGVTADIVDERTEFYESAVAASQAARASVQKAQADLAESQAKLEAARADVNLKQALVDVAGKDRDRAKALLSFATIQAPFDGAVVRRVGDPGSFVQNATTGHTEPVLTVARTDIVTVYMKLPDNYAPYISTNTDAVIQMSVLPGWEIHGKVTRFAPSLQNPEHDRTMRVEVDLFNGSRAAYERLVEQAKASGYAGLKGHKLPLFPTVKGKETEGLSNRLLPGMFGRMRLVLTRFKGIRLIPSTAVVNQGGRAYIFLVQEGRAVRVPVEVQADDGRVAKITLLRQLDGHEVRRELTGDELIVASNQGELSQGQAVRAAPPAAW